MSGHSPRTSVPVVRVSAGGGVSGRHAGQGAAQTRASASTLDIPVSTPRLPETPRLPDKRQGEMMGVQRVGSMESSKTTPRGALSPRSEGSDDGSALVTASFTSMDVRVARVVRALIIGTDGSRTGGLGLSFVIDDEGYPAIEAMAEGGTARYLDRSSALSDCYARLGADLASVARPGSQGCSPSGTWSLLSMASLASELPRGGEAGREGGRVALDE